MLQTNVRKTSAALRYQFLDILLFGYEYSDIILSAVRNRNHATYAIFAYEQSGLLEKRSAFCYNKIVQLLLSI